MAEKYSREKKKELGICSHAYCLRPVMAGYLECLEHRRKAKNTRLLRFQQGLCPNCGQMPPEAGKSTCVKCRESGLRYRRSRDQRAYLKEYRRKARAAGKCRICCNHPVEPGLRHCRMCLDTAKARRKKLKAYGHCGVCGKPVDDLHYATCSACRQKQKQRTLEIRRRVFTAYGGFRCACCGEYAPEFLHIDHIAGGGVQQRKRAGVTSGDSFYRWLLKKGCPPGYRVLCANCNLARGHYGYCPHERDFLTAQLSLGE